ncbi:MAG: PIG-L deacetylase family protein [Thermodesulfobacteriota bacterium]|nr:PIG-L deacetylase family protein [Thermodesulfobacteriota bacterium]
MKILAIGAHPDDIEIGCAGSLLKYAASGHDVYLLVMTLGEMGGEAEIRKEEQARSAEIMKVRDLFWGKYKDTQLETHLTDMISDIEAIARKIRPDFVFVNYGDDTHQDHRMLSRATISATRYTRNVLFYETPTTNNFSPTLFIDLKDTMDKKITALLAHKSQVERTNIEGLSIVDIAKSMAVFRGIQGRVILAEGFMSLRLFINI